LREDDPGPGQSGHHPASAPPIALLPAGLSQLGLFFISIGCFVLAFLFALFEAALHHHSRVRLVTAAKGTSKSAALDALLLHEEELIFASKIGRGLAQIAGIATLVAYLAMGDVSGLPLLAWALGGCTLFLLLCVAGPHLLGRRSGHVILLRGLIPYARAIAPLRMLAAMLHRAGSRLFRQGPEPAPDEEITDEILSVVEEGAREGSLDASEKDMIEGVMDLREMTAEQIMTPRTDLVCLPASATAQDAIERSQERGLSRLPVYRETPDDVIGVLYMKDLLPYLGRGESPSIEQIVRRPFFVPESKNVGELLHEMKATQTHLAVVLDEYGGTAGVVTIEDILEEIVGEIADEHERAAEREVVRINENAATVGGRTHVDELNKALDLDVPESEEYETIGGLLFNLMGRVPAAGEHYDLNGIRFTILEADERRINRVKVSVRR